MNFKNLNHQLPFASYLQIYRPPELIYVPLTTKMQILLEVGHRTNQLMKRSIFALGQREPIAICVRN